MKTLEIKIYQFNELSEKSKERALNELRHINVEDTWWNCSCETFSEFGVVIEAFDFYKRTISLGFKKDITDICDKFAYEWNTNQIGELCKAYLKNRHKEISVFQKLIDAQLCLDASNQDVLEDMENVFIKDLEYAILNWLNDEYEYLLSDDAIVDTIEANEYDFTENGKRY